MEDVSHLSIFVLQSPFKFWTCMIFSVDFDGDIQMMLRTIVKFLYVGTWVLS